MNAKKLIFPAKQMLRPEPARLTTEMIACERRSADEITAINWKRRMDLLGAAAKTPFYKNRFADIGLEVGDVRTERGSLENAALVKAQESVCGLSSPRMSLPERHASHGRCE